MSTQSSSRKKATQKFAIFVTGITAGYLFHVALKKFQSLKEQRIDDQKQDITTPIMTRSPIISHTHSDCGSIDSDSSETEMLIHGLRLHRHPEGGFFRTTYKSGCLDPMKSKGKTDEAGWIWQAKQRNLMSSIYWLQRESDSKLMSLHCAGCDIVVYFHHGTGLKYYIVDPISNTLLSTTLGPRFERGHGFQLIVPKHCWMAAIVANCDNDREQQVEVGNTRFVFSEKKEKFALVSEACCPGFDFRDWRLITLQEIENTNLNADNKRLLRRFVHQSKTAVNTDEYYQAQSK